MPARPQTRVVAARAALCLVPTVLASLVLQFVVPDTRDSLGRDAAACIAVVGFASLLAGLAAQSWLAVLLLVVLDEVLLFRLRAVWEDGRSTDLAVSAACALAVVGVCVLLRGHVREPD